MSFKLCAFLPALFLAVVPIAAGQTSPQQLIAPYAFSPEPQRVGQPAFWNISDIAAGNIDGDGSANAYQ